MTLANDTFMFWRIARDARSDNVVLACEAIDDLEAIVMYGGPRLSQSARAVIEDAALNGATHPLRVCARVAQERLDDLPAEWLGK